MTDQSPSIFSSALRSLLKTFAGVIGIALGLFVVILLFSIGSSGDEEVERTAKIKVLPNLAGKREKLDSDSPVLLEVAIDGVIGSKNLNRQAIADLLQESKEGDLKDRVKGLLVRIDSPGGGSIDSDGIYRVIKTYKETQKIPVIAYVDGIAASGGYFIAVSGDEIWSTESSIIGSIGTIISTQFNVSKPLETYGVETITITAGKDKDALNPFRPWTENDRELLQPIVDAHYQDFVNTVTSNRPRLSKEKLVADYGAKVFPAREAETLGYVDFVGKTRNEAFKALAEKAGVDPATVYIVSLEKKNWVKDLFDSESRSFADILLESFGLKVPSSAQGLERQPLWLWNP